MTLPTVLYILGAPGVGKTALARALLGWGEERMGKTCLGNLSPKDLRLITSESGYKWTRQGNVYAAGHYTGEPFDGADTVGYTQAIPTLSYWKQKLVAENTLTILDGDRFSTKPSLAFLQAMPCLRILGVHLVASPEVLEARRKAREAVTGKVQNATWAKGRGTKAANFARRMGAVVFDGSRPVSELHLRVSGMVGL